VLEEKKYSGKIRMTYSPRIIGEGFSGKGGCNSEKEGQRKKDVIFSRRKKENIERPEV